MNIQASVIICAHNSRPEYMARVLDALRAQTFPLEQWELLLIDNASAEPLAGRFDVSWHPAGRHVREDELGLTPARLRGIAEAKAELLIFVDDDNVLAPNYLATAVEIGHTWPILGAWGGHVDGEFEVEPEEWTKQYWGYLAIRPCTEARWSNDPEDWESQPIGAGLCVRRVVAERYAGEIASDPLRRKLDRTGTSLVSGGDTDLVHCAPPLGLGLGRFPQLKLEHLMPAGRLTETYLLKLVRGVACSGTLLKALRGETPQPPPNGNWQTARDIRLLLQSGPRALRFQKAKRQGISDAIAKLAANS